MDDTKMAMWCGAVIRNAMTLMRHRVEMEIEKTSAKVHRTNETKYTGLGLSTDALLHWYISRRNLSI